MKEEVYLNSLSCLHAGSPEPDSKAFFTPMQARRMGRMMKRAVVTAETALGEAGISVPDAIITGTFLGSVEDTEALLMALSGVSGLPMKPTNFMQSTHNTVSSLVGIRLGDHGYNATYSHGPLSFESAVLDALVQLGLGEIDNALVNLCDETSPTFTMMMGKIGMEGLDISLSVVLSHKAEGALCRVEDFSLTHGRKALDEAGAMEGIPVFKAPLGYAEAADLLAKGEIDKALVVNAGREYDNSSYMLLGRI